VGRKETARIALTVLVGLVAGGLVGAGIGNGLYGPVVGVSLGVAIGIATGFLVRRQVLQIRRARALERRPGTSGQGESAGLGR
jgi:hypothetical protein